VGQKPTSRKPEEVAYHSFSFLKGRPFEDPKELKDGFGQVAADALRGCAAILGEGKVSTVDLERLLIEAMVVRFTLERVEGEASKFPFDTELPLGIFLDVGVNPKASSPYALIETLCRSLARHHEEGMEGAVKAFEEILAAKVAEAEKAQVDDEGRSAAGGAGPAVRTSRRSGTTPGKGSASTTTVVTPAPLPLRIGAFFDCVAGALNLIWQEGVQAKLDGADWSLPFPLLGALLEA
jgi:hypothetical protein